MPDELEERLKSHAKAFDSLLSLIPAKVYYGEDVSDQWQRKKQTPEQKKAARLAKLDPDNWKSAKDVMDEKAVNTLKRKRQNDGETSDTQLVPLEVPKAVQESQNRKLKKQKTGITEGKLSTPNLNLHADESRTEEDRRRLKAERKAAKRERKQTKLAKLREKKDKKRAKRQETKPKMSSPAPDASTALEPPDSQSDEEDERLAEAIDLDESIARQISGAPLDSASTASPSPAPESLMLSPQLHSGTSSISSIVPATLHPGKMPESDQAPIRAPPLTQSSSQTAKERLEARLGELRAARKADGPDGKPARNRQELLDQRRKKEEERQRAKKEQRQREKEEEARRQDEEIAKRFSPGGSGSLLASPRSPMVESGNNFSFGRVAFGDGTHADAALSTLLEPRKSKGPADPATALKAAQKKASRLSGLDDAKRKEIAEKDMWLNAKKRAHGERVRDDTSLLKKALKRQEGSKKKSETDWQNRIDGVAKGQEIRQKKREENIRKRKEEKGGKGKSRNGKVKRPGFEGSFKGRTGGRKKS